MIFEILQTLGLPCAYGKFDKDPEPPYLIYMGAGQLQFEADTTYYKKRNQYHIEYYFKQKNEELEDQIEDLLLENGYRYDKSEDIYFDDEKIFGIYYEI